MLWARIALQVLGYAWPAYQTFKAVEANKPGDIKSWAIFWVIVGFFTAAQPVLDVVLFWVPLYYEGRLLAAVYLWWGGLAGAVSVYQRWVQPAILRYEPVIDQKLAESKAQLGDLVSSNFGRLVQLVQEKVQALLQQAQTKAGPPMEPRSHPVKAD